MYPPGSRHSDGVRSMCGEELFSGGRSRVGQGHWSGTQERTGRRKQNQAGSPSDHGADLMKS